MLDAIYQTAVDAIITINEAGQIESVNPATEKLFGYSSGELLGQNVKILMPSPYREEHDGFIQTYLATGVGKIIGVGREVVGKRKDATVFPAYLAVSEIKIADHRLFTGIVRDLTQFKLLEAQQTTLGRIIEDSLNEVYIFGVEDLRFIQVNHGGRNNLGYPLKELKNMTPVDIKPDFTEPAFRKLLEPLMTGQLEKMQFETRHLRKDGTTYEVEVHVQLSTYLNKPVFVAIVLDVTERRNAERLVKQQREKMQAELERLVETRTSELRQAQADLVRSEKFSTLGKVAGGIAHEIRNPLNAIKTSAYFLINAKDPSREKIAEHLERIDRQVTQIDNVVTALSDIAKLPEARLKPVEMDKIVQAAISSSNLLSNIHIALELPRDLPKVLVDEQQIVIAIKNLIRNAREAMEHGGILTIGATVGDERVELTVSDTGGGVPLEDLDRILEPLYTTKARGMGLGLSITRAIVEKNLGTLRVQSEPGKGSRFSIALKRHAEGEA
jgi:two-component system sensor kinase FixL